MTSKVVNVPNLIGSNYTIWKHKVIVVLGGNNIWWIFSAGIKKPTHAKDVDIWEEYCECAVRGLIG
jgi:hypothetical protein